MSRKIRIVIIVVFVCLFASVGYLALFFSHHSHTLPITQITTPTPILQSGSTKYTQGSMTKMEYIYTHLQPLSTTAQSARAAFVQKVGSTSGTIYSTKDFFITYDKPFNVFDAEITTEGVSTAKNEAIMWFNQQGIQGKDICNLPLTFILSAEVDYFLSKTSTVFNPIPDGC